MLEILVVFLSIPKAECVGEDSNDGVSLSSNPVSLNEKDSRFSISPQENNTEQDDPPEVILSLPPYTVKEPSRLNQSSVAVSDDYVKNQSNPNESDIYLHSLTTEEQSNSIHSSTSGSPFDLERANISGKSSHDISPENMEGFKNSNPDANKFQSQFGDKTKFVESNLNKSSRSKQNQHDFISHDLDAHSLRKELHQDPCHTCVNKPACYTEDLNCPIASDLNFTSQKYKFKSNTERSYTGASQNMESPKNSSSEFDVAFFERFFYSQVKKYVVGFLKENDFKKIKNTESRTSSVYQETKNYLPIYNPKKLKTFLSFMTKEIKCNECITCVKGGVCLNYFFSYILPLLFDESTESSKGVTDNILLFRNIVTDFANSSGLSQFESELNNKKFLSGSKDLGEINNSFIDIYLALFDTKNFFNKELSSNKPKQAHNYLYPHYHQQGYSAWF